MSVDRILQLKLIADVSEINTKMSKATKDIGRVQQAMNKLKSVAVPMALGIGAQMGEQLMAGIVDATKRAGQLRVTLEKLEVLVVNLELPEEKVKRRLARLVREGIGLGFGGEEKVSEFFTRALGATGSLAKATQLVGAAFDHARLTGEDFGTASEEVFDALIGGGDEAEEKLGVVGDTFWERMRSFNEKYGNFAEEFALTDEGEWAIIEAKWDQHMINLGKGLDGLVLQFKAGGIQLVKEAEAAVAGWGAAFEMAKPIFKEIADGLSEGWDSLVETTKGVLNTVLAGVELFINYLGAGLMSGLEAVIRPLNDVAFVGDLIPDEPLNWGWFSVPRLASGGIVTKPTLAMVGEAGPEAVIPLGSGGAGNSYTINVNAAASSPADVGRAVVEAIQAHERRAGSRWREAFT
jgi:hypothetical protein